MHRFAALLPAALVFVLPARAQDPAAAPKPPDVLGQAAPRWQASGWQHLPAGKAALEPADLRGKVVLLFCFQANCVDCHAGGFQELQEVVARYRERHADDVAFVLLHTPFEDLEHETPERAREMLARYRLDRLPRGHVRPEAAGEKPAVLRAHGGHGTPWAVVIDAEGVVRMSRKMPAAKDVIAAIDACLAAAPAGAALLGAPIGALEGVAWIAPAAAPDWRRNGFTLLRWWTDGCPFCAKSLPEIAAFAAAHEGDLRAIAVYHPKTDRPLDAAGQRRRLREFGFEGGVAADPEWTALRALLRRGEMRRATSISLLVDGEGVVRWVHPGPQVDRDELERALQRARARAR